MRFKTGPSKIHGTGVFATANIAKGEDLEQDWFALSFKINSEAITKNEEFKGFNHSCRANLTNFPKLMSIKNIREGEEVTLDYAGYVRGPCNCGKCSK